LAFAKSPSNLKPSQEKKFRFLSNNYQCDFLILLVSTIGYNFSNAPRLTVAANADLTNNEKKVPLLVRKAVYKRAYSQIVHKARGKKPCENETTTSNDTRDDYDERLSIDILSIDSVSWTQFQRDAVLSWPYMRDVMGVLARGLVLESRMNL
jgi:hypothetical protein